MKIGKIIAIVVIVLLVIATGALVWDEYHIRHGEPDLFTREVWQTKSASTPENPSAAGGNQNNQNVTVSLLALDDNECQTCETDSIIDFMQQQIFPGLQVEKVQYDSDEGAALIEKFGIVSLPAFVFGSDIQNSDQFADLQQVLVNKGDQYWLQGQYLGLPTGKFLLQPTVSAGDHVLGDPNAPVTIVDFTDFQCPVCGNYAREMFPIVKENYIDTGKANYVVKAAPLESIHPYARQAHIAAACVGEQGNDLFWKFKEKMFADQSTWATADIAKNLRQIATSAGANGAQYDQCLQSGAGEAIVTAQMAEFDSFGLSGVPAFFVGDEFMSGIKRADDGGLGEVIERQLSK